MWILISSQCLFVHKNNEPFTQESNWLKLTEILAFIQTSESFYLPNKTKFFFGVDIRFQRSGPRKERFENEINISTKASIKIEGFLSQKTKQESTFWRRLPWTWSDKAKILMNWLVLLRSNFVWGWN
jgi:hypothetical protein